MRKSQILGSGQEAPLSIAAHHEAEQRSQTFERLRHLSALVAQDRLLTRYALDVTIDRIESELMANASPPRENRERSGESRT